ncbi:MAG: hypothetical protein ACI3ZS_07215 [Candidatus Cryptobacteroides sp.]
MAKRKKNNIPGIDPEYLKKQKESLVRRHRQVIYLNDSEMAAIRNYCEKFRVGSKAVLFREAIMEKVLSELDDNHPTLF